jgi:RNase P subunit RPR2
MLLTNYQRTKAQRLINISTKKYYCGQCDKVFKDSHDLKNHLGGMKHQPHRYVAYNCLCCNYQTKYKPAFTKHLKTNKHLRLSIPPEIIAGESA